MTIKNALGSIHPNAFGIADFHFDFDCKQHSMLAQDVRGLSNDDMAAKFTEIGERIKIVTVVGAVVETDLGLGRVMDVIHVSGSRRNRVDVEVMLYNGAAERFECHQVKPAAADAPIRFFNLDGKTVEPSKYTLDYLNGIVGRGYSREIPVRGIVGYSELGMYTRKAETIGIVAFVRPDSDNYAYVLLADGTVIDGCFHLFNDHSFSLS